jgi:GntR family transcriptional regulator of vanillate catabolism
MMKEKTAKFDVLALQHIRDLILQGGLKPGERLTETGLAERLQTSRTPVRQALPALAKEGLLVPVGKRGFAVRRFTAQECRDAIRARAMLEGLAARKMTEQSLAPDILAQFRDCLAEGDAIFAKGHLNDTDEARYGEMNERFHALLFQAAQSSLLDDLVARCHVVPFVSPATIAFDKKDLQTAFRLLSFAHQQHHSIVEALSAGDAARAEFLLREHAMTQERSMNFDDARLSNA